MYNTKRINNPMLPSLSRSWASDLIPMDAIIDRRMRRLRDKLVEILCVASGISHAIKISAELMGGSFQYAADFAGAFRRVDGWSVAQLQLITSQRSPHGISVRVGGDLHNPSPDASLVIKALKAIGLEFDIEAGSS